MHLRPRRVCEVGDWRIEELVKAGMALHAGRRYLNDAKARVHIGLLNLKFLTKRLTKPMFSLWPMTIQSESTACGRVLAPAGSYFSEFYTIEIMSARRGGGICH